MKIMIPLDGSDLAEAILEPAAKVAAASTAEVHLIRVLTQSTIHSTRVEPLPSEHVSGGPVPIPRRPDPAAAETEGQALDRLRHEAEDYLKEIAARFFPRGAQELVVIAEDPAEQILNHAREEEVDLIAMATHGRTGLARLLMGSVAHTLLQARAAPLLLVRPGELH